MNKNLFDYIINNSKNLDYEVSIETSISKNKLLKKSLFIKDINKFANCINKKNIANEKIGIYVENCNNFVKIFYSIILNEKIVVSINNNINNINELNDIIDKNELDYIITNDKHFDFISRSKIKNIINVDKEKYNDEFEKIDFDINKKNEDDVLVISYTSGTSGNFSKGVELTYKNITFVSEEYKKVYKLNKKSKIITVLPLWHNYAMFACLTSSIVSESTLVIMEKWNANLFLKINKEIMPDIFPGSPYMYIDLINNYNNQLVKLTNLRICDSGGDSLPIECIKKFELATGAIITEGYGLTETSSLTHFNYSATERKVGSLGKAVSDTECKILDLNGKELPNGEWGLLWIKGPMVFKNYVKLPDDLKKVKKDEWFNTNDVVKRDDDGFYYIAGRLSDLKNLNNNDNQLRGLENELYKFSGIKRLHIKTNYNEMANFYYFDLFIILKDEYDISDVYDYINSNLKQYVIGEIKLVEDLPMTGTGKIKRQEIDKIKKIDLGAYEKEEISGGLRCKTYILKQSNTKKIYQEYYENTKYQAEKKYNITKSIKNQYENILIPDAYSWGNENDKTWLLTEFISGTTLFELRKNNFSLNVIAEELAKTLYQIHNVKINSDFGWITDKNVFSYTRFSEYLESELKRFEETVNNKINKKDFEYMILKAKEVITKIKQVDLNLKPQLIWFDLNPNNILINKKKNIYHLASIIDAGGAKYGIKEWDLAFLKMEVCINKDEYECLINEYLKLDNTLNLELIDLLSVFIELDDMIIRILDKCHLDIPYDSNFKKIIENLKY